MPHNVPEFVRGLFSKHIRNCIDENNISICFKQLLQQFNQEACIISIVSEISLIVKPMLLLRDILSQNTMRFKRFIMRSDPFY